MRRSVIIAAVILLVSTLIVRGDSRADTLQPGRYKFVAAGSGVGYRFDTATGELYQVFVGGQKLIWEGVDGAAVVGRFDLIPRRRINDLGLELDPAVWYLVDTATGHVWHVLPSGITPMGVPLE